MGTTRRKIPPRFEAFWLKNECFLTELSNTWSNHIATNSLVDKLPRVLADLKRWGRAAFGSIKTQICETEDRLLQLQSGPLNVANQTEERALQERLVHLQSLNEVYWHQRSRVNWIQAGDKNSHFFHLSAIFRKKKNTIASLLLPNGTWAHNYDDITTALINHFQTTFQSTTTTPISNHLIHSLPKISERENDLLHVVPTAEEIKAALHEMGAGKAPGPDGLPAMFYQTSWSIVGEEELFHSMSKLNMFNSSFALKLDMAKAYDRVSWSFLSQVLRGFGLTGLTHDIIMACVSNSSFSVLVNGSPQGHFTASRGLRQGCPLSPYLFILCSEVLTQITSEAERRQQFKGFQIIAQAPSISHLMFADDLFFFGPATIQNAIGVKAILKLYEDVTGLMVNYAKSSIHVSPKLDSTMNQLLIDILGVEKMKNNDKYLGKHLLLPSSRISSYEYLINSCKMKLSSWKSNSLSHAGRTVLLKSALASIPIYSMGTALLPKGVTEKLKQIQRQFWWSSSADKKKMCMIRWDSIAAPKKEGGLGIRDPHIVNLSLIAKLVWRFLSTEDSIWCDLLKAKYLRNKSFWDSNVPCNSSQLWKGMLQLREFLKTGACWNIGNGKRINLWKDPWVASIPGFRVSDLSILHPQLTSVADLILLNPCRWNEHLIRSVFDTHEAEAIIRIPIFDNGDQDFLIWRPAPDGVFTAKSMYKHLCAMQPSPSSSSSTAEFNWCRFWQIRGISPRVQMFLWRALNGGLAVGNVIRRFSNSNGWCRRCNGELETIDHTLVHCPYADEIWKNSTIPLSINHGSLSLAQLFSNFLVTDADFVRRGCAIIWEIWKARNAYSFSGKTSDAQVVINNALALYEDYKNPPIGANTELELAPPAGVDPLLYHWVPPPPGTVKINVDGACRAGSIAAAVVARGNKGNYILAESIASQFGNPVEAEAKAFKLAINMVENCNFSSAVIEGDASKIVSWINIDDLLVDWKVRPIIQACRDFRRRNPQILFTYAPRHLNTVAHALAKFAITHGVTNVWSGDLPPPFILDNLFADMAHLVNSDLNKFR